VFGTEDGTLGATIVEHAASSYVNGVCIKRPDQALALPASMLIAAAKDGPDLQRFCRDDEQGTEEKLQLTSPTGGSSTAEITYCTWNGVFHSSRPFTITLATAADRNVGDFVELVRVYRNADLMAAWNRASDQHTGQPVVIPGNSLVSGAFAATHPPHLSAMDIRVIPRGDAVTQGVDTDVRNDKQRLERLISDAFGAAFDVEFPLGSAERESIECLHEGIEHASQTILHQVSSTVVVTPPHVKDCHPLINAGADTPLSDSYKKLKHQSAAEIDQLKTEALNQIAKYRDEFIKAIPKNQGPALVDLLKKNLSAENAKLVDDCALEIEKSGSDAKCFRDIEAKPGFPKKNLDDFLRAVRSLDLQIAATLRNVDEAVALAGRIADKAKTLAGDPQKQAEVFNAFAQNLAEHGDAFEARKDNPPLLSGEQKIDMAYADKWQGFFLAPWNGVPMQVNNKMSAEFSAATAVPLVDALGFRYQWGKTRFADARFAVGFGYVEAQLASGDKKQAAALPNASVGVGNLKVGFGVVTGEGMGTMKERMRLVVGADLYKLITGDNVEAL
jgi:hypothetical protein